MAATVRARVLMSLALIVVAIAAIIFGVKTWVVATKPRCDELVQYRVSSPGGQWVADSNVEGCWMNASIYVTLHLASKKQDINERIVWFEHAYSDGYSDVILHWIDSNHLEIGLPMESSAKAGPPEFRGVQLTYTYFPNDAEQLQKRSDFMNGKLTRDDWIQYRDSHVSSIANVAAHVERTVPKNVSYAFSETTDEYGAKWCHLDMRAPDGVFFQSVEMQLIANVDRRRTAGFQVRFKTNEPLAESLTPLMLTGAQFVGSSFSNNPATVFRQKTDVSFSFLTDDQLVNFLTSFGRRPYSITLILGLPEMVIQYDINESPRKEFMASFFRCVGQVKSFGRIASDLNPDR